MYRNFFRKRILAPGLVPILVWILALAAPALAGPNPTVRLDTNLGAIHLELFREQAPVTVENFLYYVSAGFYDGRDENGSTIFHRTIDGFMIQGGGFTPEFYDVGREAQKSTRPGIPNEADNGLANDAYTVAMARTPDPASATSQFFINVADNPGLNHTAPTTAGWGYAVFGRVIEGADVVDAIKGIPTADNLVPNFEDVPTEAVTILRAEVTDLGDGREFPARLFYPHVAANDRWETEIAVINGDAEAPLAAILEGYDAEGAPVSDAVHLLLPPAGRRQFDVGEFFGNASDIRYFVLRADRETAYGYTKFHQEDRFRAAVPATAEPASGDMFVPHIASGPMWWTGIGLVNTGAEERTVEFVFDNGETATRTLVPGGHAAFDIRSLFGGNARPDIGSAVIRNAEGIVGLQLFGSTEESGNRYLDGLLLKDTAANELFFPHVTGTDHWWTGIVAYNAGAEACDLVVRPYRADGTALGLNAPPVTLLPGERYIGTETALGLPAGTAWLTVAGRKPGTSEGHPLSGLELFGTRDGNELGGFGVVGLPSASGILPRLRSTSWTGISLINTAFSRTTVTLSAMDNLGVERARETVSLDSRSKRVGIARELFSGDISAGTYIRYEADQPVATFQLNREASGFLLDGLPGLGLN
jgi:cyclophilin family peptidyl-prolyl cis-trans isomerase